MLANSAKASLLLVKHSPKLQETATTLARNLDLAYKIWLDLIDFKKDYTGMLYRTEAIVHAVYKDKYERDEEVGSRLKKAAISAVGGGSSSGVSHKKPSSALSFFATYYPSLSAAKSTAASDTLLPLDSQVPYERILADCKLLFDNHYRLALDSLDTLENENEHSQSDAVASLRSMLTVMNSTV